MELRLVGVTRLVALRTAAAAATVLDETRGGRCVMAPELRAAAHSMPIT